MPPQPRTPRQYTDPRAEPSAQAPHLGDAQADEESPAFGEDTDRRALSDPRVQGCQSGRSEVSPRPLAGRRASTGRWSLMAVKLRPQERDALYAQISANFTLFSDLELDMHQGNEEACYRLRRKISDGLRLIIDGYLLERDAEVLAAAGIGRVNVSIDSLQRDRFPALTRRDALPQVLRGLEAIAAQPGIGPVKVNAVAMRDLSQDEVGRFCAFARSTGYQVRFIEFMPLDGDRAWSPDDVLGGEELRARIEALHPLEELPREPSATARVFRFADDKGEIGAIAIGTRYPSRTD